VAVSWVEWEAGIKYPVVVVVQNDLDCFVSCQHEGIGMATVDDGVGCVGTGRYYGVQCRHPGFDVGVVVEEGTERVDEYAGHWKRVITH
jgi:hypothetical protein